MVGLCLDAFVRQVVEIGGELCLKHVILNVDDFSVHEANEVFTAHVEHVVASDLVMLVYLHATSAEKFRDIIFAEESLSNLEASATSECS